MCNVSAFSVTQFRFHLGYTDTYIGVYKVVVSGRTCKQAKQICVGNAEVYIYKYQKVTALLITR